MNLWYHMAFLSPMNNIRVNGKDIKVERCSPKVWPEFLYYKYTVVSDQNTVSVSGTVTDTEFLYQSCKLFKPRCGKHYLHRGRVRKIDDKWILHICYRTHLALCDPKKFLSNPGLINRLELACSQNWPWNIGLGFMLHCTNGSWYELTLRKNVCVCLNISSVVQF